jgi:hypothetical protein
MKTHDQLAIGFPHLLTVSTPIKAKRGQMLVNVHD